MNIFGWTIIRSKSLARIHERNKELDKKYDALYRAFFQAQDKIAELQSPIGSDLV